MSWVVMWTIVTMCPYTPPPDVDEFGRTSMWSDLVLRLKECGRVQHRKEFATHDEAKTFHDRAKSDAIMLGEHQMMNIGDNITDVKIVEANP